MSDPNDLTSPIDEGVTAEDLGRTLFIGVGGVGMNGLTRLYATRGLPVSGSESRNGRVSPNSNASASRSTASTLMSNLDEIDTVVRSDRHQRRAPRSAEARSAASASTTAPRRSRPP